MNTTGKPKRLLNLVRDKLRVKHKNVSTTMIDTHVLNHGGQGVGSSLD